MPDVLFKTTNAGAPKKHRGYPDMCPSRGLAAALPSNSFVKLINKTVLHRKCIVLVQMHFIQRKKFSKTNVTSHAFEEISDLKIFLECFCGPLKTLWWATCGPRACRWTTLIYLMQHQNIDLYSCIACESQSFKRIFYLKQIFVITGGPLGAEGPGQLPRCPPT